MLGLFRKEVLEGKPVCPHCGCTKFTGYLTTNNLNAVTRKAAIVNLPYWLVLLWKTPKSVLVHGWLLYTCLQITKKK